MKKLLSFILSLFTLVAFWSCGGDRRVDAVLDDADTLMFSRPDSATAMLGGLDLGSASTFQRARHALLFTKACSKAYRPATDDSLISFAVDQFRGRGDSLETQALFYRGFVLNSRRDYSNALISLMEAADRAADLGDDFYRAMAYREQADVYSRLYSELPRYEYSDSAVTYYLRAGRPLHALYEKINVADALNWLERPAEAFDSLLAVRDEALAAGRPYAAWLHRKLAYACFQLDDPRAAIAHLDSVELYAGRLTSGDWSWKARMAVELGQSGLAEACLINAANSATTHPDSVNIAYARTKLTYLLGNYKEAYILYNDFFKSTISEYNDYIRHPYIALVGQYYKREAAFNSAKYIKSRRQVVMWVIIAFLLLVAIVCLVIVFRHRLQLREERADILRSDMNQLKRQLDELNAAKAAPSVETAHLLSVRNVSAPHYDVFNRLCELVSRYPLSDEGHKNIGFNVSLLIKSFQSDAVKHDLENFVNATAGNLMQRFREQFAAMSDKKLNFVLLCFAGFKNQSVYIMLNFPSLGAVRTMRHRIRTEIENSDCRDKDEFLSYFC